MLIVVLLLLLLLTWAEEVKDNFGEIIDLVQLEDRIFLLSETGSLSSFHVTQDKFEWRIQVPDNGHQLFVQPNILLVVSSHSVFGYHPQDATLLWSEQFTSTLSLAYFLNNSTLTFSLETEILLMDVFSGHVKDTISSSKGSKQHMVMRSRRGLLLVQSFSNGTIVLTGNNYEAHIQSVNGEFALIADQGYIVYQLDSNRIVAQNVELTRMLPTYYFPEHITHLRADLRSNAVRFQGKKTGEQVVLRIVDDVIQEWRRIPPDVFVSIHDETNSMWISMHHKALVKRQGRIFDMPMPSEGGRFFKRAWHVQGVKKSLVFTVEYDGSALALWRHVEGFNMLSHLHTWDQGVRNKWNQKELVEERKEENKTELVEEEEDDDTYSPVYDVVQDEL